MSEEQTTPQPLPQSDTKEINASDLLTGYLVAVGKDGKLTFELVGAEPNLATLAGLHHIAGERVKLMVDANIRTGVAPIVDELIQMRQQMNVILNILTEDQKKRLLGR